MITTSAMFNPLEQKQPSLHAIVAALSFALDLTEGAVPGHAIRSCLLAMRLAEALDLPAEQATSLYYASLLKDVGCSSNASRVCAIMGADDRVIKAGLKVFDWSGRHGPRLAPARFLWTHVMPGERPWRKAGKILEIARDEQKNSRELIELRCDRGANIVRKMGFGREVEIAVRHLDEQWDGSGFADGRAGEDIPLLSRLMAVAQHLDAFCMEKGPKAAIEVLRERSGKRFDPMLVRAAQAMHRSGRLWEYCLPGGDPGHAHAAVLDRLPGGHTRMHSTGIDTICEAFADVIDAKSPYTFRHSMGVKEAAVAIGEQLGLRPDRMQMLRRAALLHDVGKLSVPNSILDKPGKLTAEEFAVIKGHPALSQQILYRIGAFQEIGLVAGEHHERLDGSGYPNALACDALSLESRVLAVADVYGALSEDRPYRPRLSREKICSIMEPDVPGKLDPRCYEALQAALAKADESAAAAAEPPERVPAGTAGAPRTSAVATPTF